MSYIEFQVPIEFVVRVDEMRIVNTMYGEKMHIKGTNFTPDEDETKLEFYCPDALEYMLRNSRVVPGKKVRIVFYGRKTIDHIEQDRFFVEFVD